eukprot:gnl/TRDRNA2_/TRDRNA2_173493_c1_seq1.p1 gnl/TRDRNA2_/TRDRNA2_173493_c1~~gnl/TRDRNA2_/TRDRNA2_173493_c1_seq1.p1  ORF type:complete len:181 (+),score=26.83 gnl/TRDRNA2_/TRDRNA2_173493_c1_seq1:560-1102(+)
MKERESGHAEERMNGRKQAAQMTPLIPAELAEVDKKEKHPVPLSPSWSGGGGEEGGEDGTRPDPGWPGAWDNFLRIADEKRSTIHTVAFDIFKTKGKPCPSAKKTSCTFPKVNFGALPSKCDRMFWSTAFRNLGYTGTMSVVVDDDEDFLPLLASDHSLMQLDLAQTQEKSEEPEQLKKS